MIEGQSRGFRGRFARGERAVEEAGLRAAAHLIGEAALVLETGEALTDKELAILLAVSLGISPREIGGLTHMRTDRSIRRAYFRPIEAKLGARNMRHAVRLGFEKSDLKPFGEPQEGTRRLSGAPLEVLRLLSYGALSSEVAAVMDITPGTVLGHVNAIKSCYQVQGEEHAIRIGIEIGDLPLLNNSGSEDLEI